MDANEGALRPREMPGRATSTPLNCLAFQRLTWEGVTLGPGRDLIRRLLIGSSAPFKGLKWRGGKPVSVSLGLWGAFLSTIPKDHHQPHLVIKIS